MHVKFALYYSTSSTIHRMWCRITHMWAMQQLCHYIPPPCQCHLILMDWSSWTCSMQIHLQQDFQVLVQELAPTPGAKKCLILQPRTSVGASAGIRTMASILNGNHSKTSKCGMRMNNKLMALSSVSLKQGDHVQAPNRAHYSVDPSFTSACAKGPVGLRNMREGLSGKTKRASALKVAALAK